MSNVLEMRNITKHFPGVLANDQVDFALRKGEIHVLLGENGAGKTTLMNILYGLTQPDTGEIIINGQQAKIQSPMDALAHGVGMVHQHFMLVPNMTVAQNVAIGKEPRRGPFLNLEQVTKRIAQCLLPSAPFCRRWCCCLPWAAKFTSAVCLRRNRCGSIPRCRKGKINMDWSLFLTPLFLVQLLAASVSLATPLVLSALGEVFAERSGVLNLGLEGIMLFGGFIGFTVAYYTSNLWVGTLSAILIGALLGLLFAFMTITLRSNQTVTGLSIMFLGNGMALYFYRSVFKVSLEIPRITPFQNIPIPLLSEIPVIGPILFNHSIFTYFMFLLVPIAMLVIYRTPFGLRLNAVGESPQTADTLGVSVSRVRYSCVTIGGALAGLAGAFYSLVELGAYSDSMVSGRGFIASALVIFGRWDPLWTFAGGLLFGGVDALQNRLQVLGSPIPPSFLQVTPYIMTILVLLMGRLRKPPAALCIPYERK